MIINCVSCQNSIVCVFLLLAANKKCPSYHGNDHVALAYWLGIRSDILQSYLELIYEMYIDLHLPQRDLITHLNHSFLLGWWTKVYSSHRPLTDTMEHIVKYQPWVEALNNMFEHDDVY